MLSLGTYPDTPLIEARKQRDTARQQLAQGVNPAAERQRKRNPIDRSFEGVARDWLACVLKLVLAGKRSRDTYEKAKNQLESYIIPELGREDVNSIRPSQLLPVLKRIEAKGLLEAARRTRQRCGQVFRHGIGLVLCERDIIDRYAGRALTRLALKLSPLVFVRPHNLRKARWEDVDLEIGAWKITGRHMKRKIEHKIPCSTYPPRDTFSVFMLFKHDGVFNASAMRNLTQGTIDHLPWAIGLVVGAILIPLGVGAAIYFLASHSDQGAAIVPLVFAVVGGYFVRTFNQYRAAEALVRASTVRR